jgi:hypothetical protein
MEFINQPVLVEMRFLPDGQVQPRAFRWRNQVHPIVDVGRQWQEQADETTWHCYLVRTVDGSTFELRLDEAGARWLLARAWLVRPMV